MEACHKEPLFAFASYVATAATLRLIVDVRSHHALPGSRRCCLTGGEIKTCRGAGLERDLSLGWIEEHRDCGAVLDLLTFWTAVEIGAIDVLQEVFGRTAIAQSSVDELSRMMDEASSERTRKSGTAAYFNGEFFFAENTPELMERRNKAFELRKAALTTLQILPVRLASEPTLQQEQMLSTFGVEMFASALIAVEHSMVLISDDIAYRSLSKSLWGVPGAWLQAVFMFARSSGLVDIKWYAELSAGLARFRHGFVAIEAAMLSATLPVSGTVKDSNFQHLSAYIGTKSADFVSHLQVTVEFLSSVWRRPTIGLTEMSATGLILEQLTRFTGKTGDDVISWLGAQVPDFRFRDYLQR